MIPRNWFERTSYRGKPRASGDDPQETLLLEEPGQVNPARAGMIPGPRARCSADAGKPRASGDDPPRVGGEGGGEG